MKEFIYATREPFRHSQEACAGNVRWFGGKLQQLFVLTEYVGGSATERREEWRDVPTVKAGTDPQ